MQKTCLIDCNSGWRGLLVQEMVIRLIQSKQSFWKCYLSHPGTQYVAKLEGNQMYFYGRRSAMTNHFSKPGHVVNRLSLLFVSDTGRSLFEVEREFTIEPGKTAWRNRFYLKNKQFFPPSFSLVLNENIGHIPSSRNHPKIAPY